MPGVEVAPRSGSHTILSRAGGPDLLLLEEPVGSLPKKEEVVPVLHRDDTTEAALRLTRRGCDALSAGASAKAEKARALRAWHEQSTVDGARATFKARCVARQRGLEAGMCAGFVGGKTAPLFS